MLRKCHLLPWEATSQNLSNGSLASGWYLSLEDFQIMKIIRKPQLGLTSEYGRLTGIRLTLLLESLKACGFFSLNLSECIRELPRQWGPEGQDPGEKWKSREMKWTSRSSHLLRHLPIPKESRRLKKWAELPAESQLRAGGSPWRKRIGC